MWVTEEIRRQIVQKYFGCPGWRSLKISPPKVEKPTYETELYYYANFHADRRQVSVPGQKIHIFSYRGLPWGLPPYAIHFWKALVEPMLRPIWHVTLRFLTFSRYSQSKFGILGPLVGTPKGEKTCPGLISTIVQHFTPIGGTFAEISVTGHIQI